MYRILRYYFILFENIRTIIIRWSVTGGIGFISRFMTMMTMMAVIFANRHRTMSMVRVNRMVVNTVTMIYIYFHILVIRLIAVLMMFFVFSLFVFSLSLLILMIVDTH